jgi:hypothetical protein
MTEKASNMLQQAASAINTLQSSGPIDKEFEISTAKYHILRATVVLLAIHAFLDSNVLRFAGFERPKYRIDRDRTITSF